jgi:hypothetical protein
VLAQVLDAEEKLILRTFVGAESVVDLRGLAALLQPMGHTDRGPALLQLVQDVQRQLLHAAATAANQNSSSSNRRFGSGGGGGNTSGGWTVSGSGSASGGSASSRPGSSSGRGSAAPCMVPFPDFIALVPAKFVVPLKTGCIVELNAPRPPSVERSAMTQQGR